MWRALWIFAPEVTAVLSIVVQLAGDTTYATWLMAYAAFLQISQKE